MKLGLGLGVGSSTFKSGSAPDRPNAGSEAQTTSTSYFQLYGRRRGTAPQPVPEEGSAGPSGAPRARRSGKEKSRPVVAAPRSEREPPRALPSPTLSIGRRGSSLAHAVGVAPPSSPRITTAGPPSILLRADSSTSTTSASGFSSPRSSLVSLSPDLTTPGSPTSTSSGQSRFAQRPWIRARTSSKAGADGAPTENEIAGFKPSRYPRISFGPRDAHTQMQGARTPQSAGRTPTVATMQRGLTQLIIDPPNMPTPRGMVPTPPLTPRSIHSPPRTPLPASHSFSPSAAASHSPASPRSQVAFPTSSSTSPAGYASSSRRSSAANSLAPGSYRPRRPRHAPSKASLRGGDPSVASRAGSDTESGDEGLIASVSTDMMDSFIDGMNAGAVAKQKRRSKASKTSRSSWQSSGAAAEQGADEPLRAASGRSPSSARARKRSGSTPPASGLQSVPSSPMGPARSGALVGEPRPPTPPSKPLTQPETPPAASRSATTSAQSSPASLSIDEIIRKNKAMSPHAFATSRSRHAAARAPHGPASTLPSRESPKQDVSRRKAEPTRPAVDFAESMRLLAQLEGGDVPTRAEHQSGTGARVRSGSASTATATARPAEPSNGSQDDIASYLRSYRLTRMITLRKPQVPGQVVSLADIGDPTGHPVMVFLGLGSVRYLVALFDEIASAHGVRLLCVDRPGLGRSTAVPAEKRGVAEWAEAIEDVLDQLALRRFGILAHSAGVPYALAAALHMPQRIIGDIQLLAPWVNKEIGGTYNWLRYVPSAVIKTAQATEWKIQGWMLGKPPKPAAQGIAFDAGAHLSNDPGRPDSRQSKRVIPVLAEQEVDYEVLRVSYDAAKEERDLRNTGSPSVNSSKTDLGLRAHSRSLSERSADLLAPRAKRISLLGRAKTRSPTPPMTAPSPSLAVSLLQASHAEALSGGTADLLTIMGKDDREWGYEYTDVTHPCVIWWGERDDKISERAVRWMEREMPSARLKVIPDEGHNLMTSSRVMVDVLDALAADARRSARG